MTRRTWTTAALCMIGAACGCGDKQGADTSSAWFTFSRGEQGSLIVSETDKRQYELISWDTKTTSRGTFDAATVSELEELLDAEALEIYYAASAQPDDDECYGGAGYTLTITTHGTGCWIYEDTADATTHAALGALIALFDAAKRLADGK